MKSEFPPQKFADTKSYLYNVELKEPRWERRGNDMLFISNFM